MMGQCVKAALNNPPELSWEVSSNRESAFNPSHQYLNHPVCERCVQECDALCSQLTPAC